LKELVDLLMKLDDAQKEEEEGEQSNEVALQLFLRKAEEVLQ
jgi:hypothetical protein